MGDLDESGAVDGGDLGILLSARGACSSPCPADLDCSGFVDGGDLGVVLAGWDGTQGLPRDCGESLLGGGSGSSMSGEESGGLALAELMSILGFDDVEAFVAWVTSLPYEEMVAWLELVG